MSVESEVTRALRAALEARGVLSLEARGVPGMGKTATVVRDDLGQARAWLREAQDALAQARRHGVNEYLLRIREGNVCRYSDEYLLRIRERKVCRCIDMVAGAQERVRLVEGERS